MTFPPGVEPLLWAPVLAGFASLAEVRDAWSLDEVLDAADVIAAMEG